MSYYISLINTGNKLPVRVSKFSDNGIPEEDNSTPAVFRVTHGYSKLFNFRSLDGRLGRDSLAQLRVAMEMLGTDVHIKYWFISPGNVGTALRRLLSWAEHHPEGVWKVE